MIYSDLRNVSSFRVEFIVDAGMIDPVLFQSSLEEQFSSPRKPWERVLEELLSSDSIAKCSELSLNSLMTVKKQELEPSYNSSGNQKTQELGVSFSQPADCSIEQDIQHLSDDYLSQFLDFEECENKVIENSKITTHSTLNEMSNFLLPSLSKSKKIYPKEKNIKKYQFENTGKISKKCKTIKDDEKERTQKSIDTNLGGILIGISQFTEVNNKRYEFIIKQAAEKSLNLLEVKNILSLISTKIITNNIVTYKTKQLFNINSKLEILFLFGHYKNENTIETENCLKLKDRFPFLETTKGLFLKVRSSCIGKNTTLFEKQDEQMMYSSVMEPKWLVALNQFKIFKRVMDDNELKNKRKRKHQQEIKNYIKRPSNSFMLYRNSMLKSLIILIILNILKGIILQYCEILSSSKNMMDEIPPELENLILQLIKNDLLKQRKSNFLYFQNTENKILNQIYSRNDYLLKNLKIENFRSEYKKSENIRKLVIQKFQKSINSRTKEISSPNTDLNYNYAIVCHVISFLWISESDKIKEKFKFFSDIEKNIHKEQFPSYKFNPRKNRSKSFPLK